MAALLPGLLVASAKSAYDSRASELTQMAAIIVLADRALAHYGPEAGPARSMLKRGLARLINQVWPQDGKHRLLPPLFHPASAKLAQAGGSKNMANKAQSPRTAS